MMDMPLKKALSPLIPLPVAANKRIAFATCLSKPDSTTDDAPLIAVLARAGYQAEAIPWDEPAAPWHHYAAVVIRSTWNYHTQKEKFKVWLKELERADIPVFNSITTLQWNMDKRYLSGLQAKGIPVPDLRFLEEGIPADVEEVFLTTHWKKAVIKPCVSATARNTWVTTPGQTGDTEGGNFLDAGVEGVSGEGIFTVMELDLIEPVLFFNNNKAAIEKFVTALLRKL